MTSRAKAKAAAFAKVIAQWDGPKLAADMLFEHYGNIRPRVARPHRPAGNDLVAECSGFRENRDIAFYNDFTGHSSQFDIYHKDA